MVAAAAGGDSFPNSGYDEVVFANSGGGAITVTFAPQGTDNFGVSGTALQRQVTVPNGAVRFRVGTFNPAQFNDVNGRVQMTYSGVTGLTVAVLGR